MSFRERITRPDAEHRLQFRGINLEYARVTSATEYEFRAEGNQHYLAFHDLVLADGELHVDGMPMQPGGDLRNKMTYVPAGRPLSGWSRTTGRQNSFTILHFDPALLSEETETVLGGGEVLPLIYFDDPALLGTMNKLQAMIGDGTTHSHIYVETLALLASLELAKLQTGKATSDVRTGRLSKSQETLLRDFIESHLSQEIRLDDLAQLVQLSRFHLARRFKMSFGAPPHQYVTLRRIEHAKRLLMETGFPVGEIATASGFSSPGPFIKIFKQSVGVTPAVYRRR